MGELFQKTAIEGCFLFKNKLFQDERGTFSKIYSADLFKSMGLHIPVGEVFYSHSNKNVIRGMHFQAPPHDQVKIVSCLSGRVLDVVLDLRKKSKTYGQAVSFELTGTCESTVIIPKGCAHGFYSHEDNSLIAYIVETCYHKESDYGVLWNSFGFQWPCENLTMSDRDKTLTAFEDFKSPF